MLFTGIAIGRGKFLHVYRLVNSHQFPAESTHGEMKGDGAETGLAIGPWVAGLRVAGLATASRVQACELFRPAFSRRDISDQG